MAETPHHTSPPQIQRVLELSAFDQDLDKIQNVAKALSSDTRLKILRFLGNHTCSLLEIAEALDLPQSTSTMHINILEKAGLIKTGLQPAKRGVQKVCARLYDRVSIELPLERDETEQVTVISMPIGAYSDVKVSLTCGLLSDTGIIGSLDDPAAFFEPDHIRAQLIWFNTGYLEYRFPYRPVHNASLESLEVSFEVCSEAPLHHPNWPSDITLWINQVELGYWTSPADFGGERGSLTPSWWDTNNTQYGLLKVWKVTHQGTFVDGVQISQVRLADLNLSPEKPITVRIGVKEDARNVGGINLFGSRFGNYPQDILLRLTYKTH
ncbi:MAG: helix-turn-helix domain-containing protein [Chloroflexi bacterium]|jgi:predicted transcriptional regulator|nr:helix-turn-helix domain-containing protein [Chloroflexota bacterium]